MSADFGSNVVNPFSVRRSENKWILPISVMLMALGFMTSVAWLDNADRSGRIQRLSPDQRERLSLGTLNLAEENESLRSEVTKLREENTKLQNAVAQNSNASDSLNKSLQEMKLFSALTPVQGPGIAITLRDVKTGGPDEIASMGQIIHDTDVLRVVNELKNAGAEAIAVNNRRVGPNTNFRCVGTTILVDETKIASPVLIKAMGDSATLFGAINLPGGILDEIRQTDPKMVDVQLVTDMRLPAFSGSTTFKVAKVPVDRP
ncbi:MAG: DUF881 domain-containing protein [Armatimonadetes bacterium]|nr:DUF881 domain-containing protein [Armatimonadota bacterium]